MTPKEELIAGLQKLMKSDGGLKRSKMGLVFELYDTLLEQRNLGVKASVLEALLNDPGGAFNFKLPPGSLTSYMHRVKLKKAASRVEHRAAVEPAVLVVPKTKAARKPKASAAAVVSAGVAANPLIAAGIGRGSDTEDEKPKIVLTFNEERKSNE